MVPMNGEDCFCFLYLCHSADNHVIFINFDGKESVRIDTAEEALEKKVFDDEEHYH